MKPRPGEEEDMELAVAEEVPARDWSLGQALVEACRQGELEQVQALVARGAPVEFLGEDKVCGLRVAAEQGHLKILNYLIQEGAGCNLINTASDLSSTHNLAMDLGKLNILCSPHRESHPSRGTLAPSKTPLLYVAAENGMSQIVSLLLKLGVNADALGPNSKTALMVASERGDIQSVQLLVEGGCDLNAEYDGDTALMFAVKHGRTDVVRYLLHHGAQEVVADEASAAGDNILIEDDCEFMQVAPPVIHPLWMAANLGKVGVVETLVEAGCSVDGKWGMYNTTALYESIAHKHACVARVLLAARADVNLCDDYFRMSPLLLATKIGDTELVHLLLDAGADLLHPNASGNTALHTAVEHSHTPLVVHFLDLGVPVDITNKGGNSPLIIAARTGEMSMVRLLIHAGSNVNLCNADGETALHEAARRGEMQITEALIEAGADVDGLVSQAQKEVSTPLILATMYRNHDIAWLLIHENCDVSYAGYRGTCALSIALERRFYDVARMLLLADCALPKSLKVLAKLHYERNDICDYIREQLVCPSSLMCICRRQIRKLLKTNFHTKLESLVLPKALKNYIALLPDLALLKP